MPVSKDDIICPYCKRIVNKAKVLGISGLINHAGMTVGCVCDKCGMDFDCEVRVSLSYKTIK